MNEECVICGSHNKGSFIKDNRKRERFVCNKCWEDRHRDLPWFEYWLNKNTAKKNRNI